MLVMLVVWLEVWLCLQFDYCSMYQVQYVWLFDGSCVVLDVDSVIVVCFNVNVCEVELLCGCVWFEVSLDVQWCFSVCVGNGLIEDIFIVFIVVCGDDGVEIQVGQGRVCVVSLVDGGWIYLQQGQCVVYIEYGGVM